ncbi:helix-turn-helix transcriptional regulator [Agreia bicolorata]|uniref:helix-turn-helix transcriptional regulator n=1 Tax=Agreia bicolorata TaxID=110935 RepID=UPI0005C980EB|nr:WYL domain-containing protein [Agreia bicolorata]
MSAEQTTSGGFHHAQDKLTFLLSLVPYLIQQSQVSVHDAARHFGVSDETIREAVLLIAVSGVPGSDSNYQHGDLFDIDWDAFDENEIIITQLVAIDDSPRFSAREASALIAGLQYIQSLPENVDSAAYSSLATKLARGASETPSQVIVSPAATNETFARIGDALSQGVQLEFDYRDSRGQTEHRRVDPLRLDSDDDDWYLRAWCHSRHSVRTFRLDRIDALRVTDLAIDHRPADVPLSDSLFDTSGEHTSVVLEFRPEALSLLGEFVPEGTRVTRSGDMSRASVRVAHFNGLTRLVAGLAGVARVVDPPEARQAARRWALDALAAYPDSPSSETTITNA